ncbi:hypothetical protein COB11_00905 [Candidatus Aerophobetes bacterium]|uniref:O-succinylbenzoate--CoA ligase n=1 Tax=Aerophobetes bacterium TaxID=2030807 RepID=A0A2A4YM23_UNCAE|nr:MAG: hypothetical protein COB11_00905 [Candidatus Aerophobetes bacterium]
MSQILDLFKHAHDDQLAIASDTFELTYKELIKRISEFEMPSCGIKVGLIADLNPTITICYFALLQKGKQVVLLNPKEPKNTRKNKLRELGISHVFSCDENGGLLFKTTSVKQKPHTDGIATYLFTSGSSGGEKIVALSIDNHILSAKGIVDHLDLTENSRYLITLPLSHVAGLSILYRCFMKGACALFTDSNKLYSSMSEKAITHVSLVSTQLTRLIKDWEKPIPSLKAILLGGSRTERTILEKAYHAKMPIYLSYGMSEMSSTITLKKIESIEQLDTSGFILPYRGLKISQDGEILTFGETLFKGYLNKATGLVEASKKAFPTKDIGSYSKDCGLIVKRRKDSMFISGGENIHPEEIEQHLYLLSGINNAVVTSIPNDEYGNITIAFIKTTKALNKDKLLAHLRKSLPGYKIPKHFLLWPEDLQAQMKVTKALRKKLSLYAYESLRKSEISS